MFPFGHLHYRHTFLASQEISSSLFGHEHLRRLGTRSAFTVCGRQLRLFNDTAVLQPWMRILLESVSLAMSNDRDCLPRWVPLVLEGLCQRYASNPRTADKVVADARRLLTYLQGRGVDKWSDVTAEMVSHWCWVSRVDRQGQYRRTAQSTARNRQWIASAMFDVFSDLGAPVDTEALVGERILRLGGAPTARPLTPEEANRVREYADAGLVGSRRSLLVVFSFAGGTATEVAAVRMGDVNLQTATVVFEGSSWRVNPLDEWGVSRVARFVRNRPPIPADHLICVTSRVRPERAAHSVTVRLRDVIRDAGLSDRERVSARSIRLTTARGLLDTHGIETAARFLGSPSLDNTAAALGHNWRNDGR